MAARSRSIHQAPARPLRNLGARTGRRRRHRGGRARSRHPCRLLRRGAGAVREIPTEIGLGETEGLAVECAASFDNLQRLRHSALAERIGELGSRRASRSALPCAHSPTADRAHLPACAFAEQPARWQSRVSKAPISSVSPISCLPGDNASRRVVTRWLRTPLSCGGREPVPLWQTRPPCHTPRMRGHSVAFSWSSSTR